MAIWLQVLDWFKSVAMPPVPAECPPGFPAICGVGQCTEAVPAPQWCQSRGMWRTLSQYFSVFFSIGFAEGGGRSAQQIIRSFITASIFCCTYITTKNGRRHGRKNMRTEPTEWYRKPMSVQNDGNQCTNVSIWKTSVSRALGQ